MKTLCALLIVCLCIFSSSVLKGKTFETDTISTESGPIKITFIGHGTLYMEYNGKVIHIDPWTKLADYTKLPKADLILITHEHFDHLDREAVSQIKKAETRIVYTKACSEALPGGEILNNNQAARIFGFDILALPSYNIEHKRDNGMPFHPKGRGNAYLLTLGKTKILIGGDTENIPELKSLKNIDIAFLPMNLPYTMTPKMVADLAIAMKPKILYPYHFGETDTGKLVKLLADYPEIEVRIRNMQ
ncbi:MAG: MBL fold metallo-hydrolase [Candidatus Rifleibacteriota bacterium]